MISRRSSAACSSSASLALGAKLLVQLGLVHRVRALASASTLYIAMSAFRMRSSPRVIAPLATAMPTLAWQRDLAARERVGAVDRVERCAAPC